MSVVVNPSGKTYFYTPGGTAYNIDRSKVKSGAVKGIVTNAVLDGVGFGANLLGKTVVKHGLTGACAVKLSGTTAISGVANNGGLCQFTTADTAALSAGQTIVIADSAYAVGGVHVIKTVDGGTTFTTYRPSTYYASAGTMTYRTIDTAYQFANMQKGRYVIVGGGAATNWLAGVANTTLRSPANDGVHRSVNKTYLVRDAGVATAIRAGYWNVFTGKFTTLPTAAATGIYDTAGSGVTDSSTDNAIGTRTIPGELVYLSGAADPTQEEFSSKTAW